MYDVKILFKIKFQKATVTLSAASGEPAVSGQPVDKFKARAYVAGWWDKAGVDYAESFAPTPRAVTQKLFFVYVVEYQLFLFFTDAVCCYNQNRKASRVIVGRMPKELRSMDDEGDELALQFLTTPYGTGGASYEWSETYDTWMLVELRGDSHQETQRRTKRGLTQRRFRFQRTSDPCLYVLEGPTPDNMLCVLRQTDDAAIGATRAEDWYELRTLYADRFEITGGAEPCVDGDFNGAALQYDREAQTLSFRVTQQIDAVAQKAGLVDIKHRSLPITAHAKVTKTDGPVLPAGVERMKANAERYRSVVCTYLWIANFAFEMTYAVSYLTRYLRNPGPVAWAPTGY